MKLKRNNARMKGHTIMQDTMLSVIISAYNQENFIKDAIEGVLSQKTAFRYEILVHDDASTDKTADIIREYEEKYPGVVKGIYETENQFQKGRLNKVVFDLKREGKYFAFLDGDDYWIDREKLQKQVEFLESHEDYSMCMHNAIQMNYLTGEKKLLNTFPGEGTYSQEEQVKAGLGTNFPAMASCVFRTAYLKDMPEFFLETSIGDYPYRNYYANCGKVYYFDRPMTIYRVGNAQSFMGNLRRNQNFYNTYTLQMIRFYEKFNSYTENRFHQILEKKIISDYLGFCTSIGKAEGIKKASEFGLNMDRLEKCYRHTAEDSLDESVRELSVRAGHLFIYGISRLGTVCSRQMDYAGIPYEGFVVSDGQDKPERVEGRPVYNLSEVIANYEKPGFVLGIQPVNVQAVADVLEKHNLKEYCMPYIIPGA